MAKARSNVDISATFTELTSGYMELPLAQKIIFPLLIIASVMGIVFISKWANQADYTVLYSDLEQADSAAVVDRLKAMKINYEVRGDGTTIAISPPELVHELRLSLASEGIPSKGTVGFEIFDTNMLGITNFVEKVKWLRAKQGELERTIASIDAVATARVHITQPEKSVFAKDAVVPTASVMLKLRPGGELTVKQVKGIANLVAGSVEGLKPDKVSIVDTYGNLLTPSEEERAEEALGAEATRIEYQREVERGYVQRVEQLLQKILGPGKVIARVTADIDFSSSQREEESYDPGGQVIRSERLIAEGQGEAQRGGVPGVVSNLTNDPNLLAPQEASSENSSRTENVKNYEVSRALTKSSSPRGVLTRLSVAVLVDGTYEEAPAEAMGAEGEGTAPPTEGETVVEKIFRPLSPEMISQIEGLVKSAVGFDQVRGDTITVESISFHQQDDGFEKDLQTKQIQDWVREGVSKGGALLFMLLFFLLVIKPLVRFLITPSEAEIDLQKLLPTGIAELERELDQERAKAVVPSYEPTVDLEQLEEIMAENSRLVKENPQQAALLIRWWLNDGRL
jgi:flagellar M-ring protein FliF